MLLSFVMSDVTQLNLRNQNLASLVSTIVKRFFTLLTFVAKPQWLGGKSAVVGLARVDTGLGTRGRVCSFARFVVFFPTLWSSWLKNLVT